MTDNFKNFGGKNIRLFSKILSKRTFFIRKIQKILCFFEFKAILYITIVKSSSLKSLYSFKGLLSIRGVNNLKGLLGLKGCLALGVSMASGSQ